MTVVLGVHQTSKTNDTVTLVPNGIGYDRRLTDREVANDVGVSVRTCRSILSDEFLKKVAVFARRDNTPAYSALSVRAFLASKNIPVVAHPSYSADFVPYDCFLFPRLKSTPKGQRFDEIIHNATQES